MKVSVLMEKLWVNEKEFVTSAELKAYCSTLDLDYTTTVKNFAHRGHLVRIFRGIFYVRPPEGMMLASRPYNHLELVAKGMEMKGVRKWYFGLHTALKLNNMTHEYFTIDEVVSDSLFRAKPVSIAGHKFRFVKIVSSLLDFGIVDSKGKGLRHSDPEKTLLDFIYLSKNKGKSPEMVAMDLKDWAADISNKKILTYAKKYPKTVVDIARLLIK